MNKIKLNRILLAKRLKSFLPFSKRAKPLADVRLNNQTVSNKSTTRYGKNASLPILIKDCFISLFRTPPKNTILICALALTLPAAIAIFSASFKAAERNLLESRTISVFLSENINLSNAAQLAKVLASNQYILTAKLTPVAIQDSDILTIDIQPSATLSNTQLDNIVAELNSHTSVDFVAADSIWLEQNVEAINTARKFGWLSIAITVPITMVLAYLISFTDLIRQKPELKVLHQMGASRNMLLKPLMLRSLTLTILALVVATLLAWSAIEILPHVYDISTYNQIIPRSIPILQIVSLGFIAIFSSFLTVGFMSQKAIKSL